MPTVASWVGLDQHTAFCDVSASADAQKLADQICLHQSVDDTSSSPVGIVPCLVQPVLPNVHVPLRADSCTDSTPVSPIHQTQHSDGPIAVAVCWHFGTIQRPTWACGACVGPPTFGVSDDGFWNVEPAWPFCCNPVVVRRTPSHGRTGPCRPVPILANVVFERMTRRQTVVWCGMPIHQRTWLVGITRIHLVWPFGK